MCVGGGGVCGWEGVGRRGNKKGRNIPYVIMVSSIFPHPMLMAYIALPKEIVSREELLSHKPEGLFVGERFDLEHVKVPIV